jgi:hypothetical protein
MNILDTLMSAAKGAAAGAVAGPIGAAVGGLGGLVVDISPDIGKWLFGSSGEKTAGLLAQAVETVTGTKDADAAQKVLEREPEAVLKLQQQIAGIVAQQQAEANRAAEAQRASELAAAQAADADRAGARSQALSFAQLHSYLAWTPAVLSGIILIVFGVLIFLLLIRHGNDLSDATLPLANVLLGTLAAMATQVANYWLGSSSGSAAKSDQVAALSASAQTTVPADLVHRMLHQTASWAGGKSPV